MNARIKNRFTALDEDEASSVKQRRD